MLAREIVDIGARALRAPSTVIVELGHTDGSPLMQPTGSAAILTPITEAAIFLTLTVDPGAEDAVRDVLADVSGLRRSVGFRIPEGELTCVVGIGAAAWDRLFGAPRPAELHPFPGLAGATAQRARRRPATCSSTSARTGSTCASSSRSG